MTTASSPLAHNAKNKGQYFPAATAADSASGGAAYRRAGKNRKMYANLYALPRRAAIDWIAFGTLMVLSVAVFIRIRQRILFSRSTGRFKKLAGIPVGIF